MSTATATPSAAPSRGLHIGLWVVQAVLGVMFTFAGFAKATKPMSELLTMMPWTAATGEALTRFIGVSEILGGLGLILPAALRIKPKLTGVAAAGLVTVMVLAAGFHIMRGEYPGVVFNAILGGLAGFVAWGRLSKAPIAPR